MRISPSPVTASSSTTLELIPAPRTRHGHAIADTVNLFNPRVIAIGGQLAHTDEQLFAGMREIVYRRSLPLATRNLQIAATSTRTRACSAWRSCWSTASTSPRGSSSSWTARWPSAR
ncbi:hypothetical protein [Nonomuraea sp. JJY05]|uniref:hypothetical protein n=1 Tax=Nonomuraea sp. JJY05 TaxID=3350255 RepID=UPI00373E2161